MIGALSARGLLVGTAQSAGLPALYAATSPDAHGGRFHGPDGFGGPGGAPAELGLYRPLRSTDAAERIRRVSQELTGVSFDGGDTVATEDTVVLHRDAR